MFLSCTCSDESSIGYLESVQHVLSGISEVCALESVVAHLELGYSGTCDCIATYKSEFINYNSIEMRTH